MAPPESSNSGINPQGSNKTTNSARTTTQPIQTAEAHNKPRPHAKTAAENTERNRKAAEDLAAVNGVVSPSQVPPGQSPRQGSWVETASSVHPCSICARKFARKEQVKYHMPVCVRRNGNPNGVRWDDAWSQDDQDLATEDSESQDDEIENDQSHAGLTANMLADHSLSNTSSYDSALPLAGLTNEALLEMKEAWKEIARQKGKDYAASHPHCRKVLIELVARGMAD